MNAVLRCEDIRAALDAIPACEQSDRGLCFTTHCLYPSFEPVSVYAVRIGDGMTVHDGGGAARSAWLHGRDSNIIARALNHQAAVHHLTVKDETLTIEIASSEWLAAAIMAVANASARAAHAAAEVTQQAFEDTLRDLIRVALRAVVNEKTIGEDFEIRGKSGKRHRFDFGIRERSGSITLVDGVTPHHVSIASRYMAFSDTSGASEELRGRFIVHDKPLNDEDVALLTQFADIVPYKALQPRFRRYFA